MKKKKDLRMKKIEVEVPAKTRKRYKWISHRVLWIDLRLVKSPNFKVERATRKLRFNSPEHLKSCCDEYFASCMGPIFNSKTGRPYEKADGSIVIGQVKPFTISGLANHLGIQSKFLRIYGSGLYDEIGIPEEDEYICLQYSKVMQQARQRIEAYAEERLYDRDGFGGSKFVLDCAFKWITSKESSDILYQQELAKYKKEEFKLKKKLLNEGAEENEPFTITIKRAGQQDE